jgi:hypothetical protein
VGHCVIQYNRSGKEWEKIRNHILDIMRDIKISKKIYRIKSSKNSYFLKLYVSNFLFKQREVVLISKRSLSSTNK